MKDKIYVTKPSLPPLDEYVKYLEKIWSSKQITNNGPFHQKFEKKLANYLGVKYVSLCNNATTGLIIALKALEVKGEVITTPFSFIATSHAIKWNGLTPVFVDTDKNAGNLDPEKVQQAITHKTGSILAVHNFGIPGDLDGLMQIAQRYKIPLIYDAAPCMGIKYRGYSLTNYGDLSILSFHGTKVFTTFEGGAIISKSKNMKLKIDKLKNFGIEGPEVVSSLGINGKMNEAEAAMGLLQLKYLNKNIKKRQKVYISYSKYFKNIDRFKQLEIPEGLEYNYAYLPIQFKDGIKHRDEVYNRLKREGILCRKYWYPLATDHDVYKKYRQYKLINSKKLSDSLLCLPIYPDINESTILQISNIILAS